MIDKIRSILTKKLTEEQKAQEISDLFTMQSKQKTRHIEQLEHDINRLKQANRVYLRQDPTKSREVIIKNLKTQ